MDFTRECCLDLMATMLSLATKPLDPAVSRYMETCPLGGISLTSNGGS
jgi:hypothetical protein